MQISSYYTHNTDINQAVRELTTGLASKPSFIICYYTEHYSVSHLSVALYDAFPDTVIQGCSSCEGVMTEAGFHKGPVIAVLALYDSSPIGAYGSALAQLPSVEFPSSADVASLTAQTLNQAIEQAGRIGELPDLVILHATPGIEEVIVEQLEKELKGNVKLIGGSAADNQAIGNWSILCDKQFSCRGISISVLYPSKPLLTAFSSGYFATAYSGVVTQAQGRRIFEIDHRNAADVYLNWTKVHAIQNLDSGNETSMHYTLGRVAGHFFNRPYYKLSHPLEIDTDQGIRLFTNIAEGDHVYLMSGGKEQLIKRASHVPQSALNAKSTDIKLHGGINIFCAGSMRIVRDEIQQVYLSIRDVYQGLPFICPFTYGEQGCFVNGENAHGNLMLSSVIFYSDV